MPPPTGLVWGRMEKLYQSVFTPAIDAENRKENIMEE